MEGMRSVEEAVNCGIVKQLFVLKGTKTASQGRPLLQQRLRQKELNCMRLPNL